MRTSQLAFLAGLLLLPGAVLLMTVSGWWPIRADVAPSAFETWVARRAVDAGVRRQAVRLANPIAATPEEFRTGLRIFRNNCAGCHGDGYRTSAWGKEFYPPVPQFGRTTPRKSDRQLFWIVKHGVRYTAMGGWDGQLPDERLWRAVTFLSHLESLPPAVDSAWHAAPPE